MLNPGPSRRPSLHDRHNLPSLKRCELLEVEFTCLYNVYVCIVSMYMYGLGIHKGNKKCAIR